VRRVRLASSFEAADGHEGRVMRATRWQGVGSLGRPNCRNQPQPYDARGPHRGSAGLAVMGLGPLPGDHWPSLRARRFGTPQAAETPSLTKPAPAGAGCQLGCATQCVRSSKQTPRTTGPPAQPPCYVQRKGRVEGPVLSGSMARLSLPVLLGLLVAAFVFLFLAHQRAESSSSSPCFTSGGGGLFIGHQAPLVSSQL